MVAFLLLVKDKGKGVGYGSGVVRLCRVQMRLARLGVVASPLNTSRWGGPVGNMAAVAWRVDEQRNE